MPSGAGIGIRPDELPQICRRFHRARIAAAIPGNGVGLVYVKAVAELAVFTLGDGGTMAGLLVAGQHQGRDAILLVFLQD
jgi:hypothetical protein